MAEQTQKFNAPVALTGTLVFDASSDEDAVAWLHNLENKRIGMALVYIDGVPCKLLNTDIRVLEEALNG
tara:strand:- start:5735 stop:5941 length:207 start_codon:yes stop_codon:yes gene_type:complete